ncbi:MAG: HlyD family efflux transporter periplasmic adaptor subunit [Agathobaculum sp.]|uniref:efflux RND transporter periplasmic adaptor subunit n=2 Tax=Agathobaculum sp. TaxID=2048138 RepID=UPI0025C0A240|nr:HlyD family efflux transporter periplasmic adaptor subunit [Agathobaculum sp.]MCI7124624.1 HlyD family efflux transporter periplasmic adaptor subunit [Agathobaculum sp.]
MHEDNKQQEKKNDAYIAKTDPEVSVTTEVIAEDTAGMPKRNRYADKMNRKKGRLSKGLRTGIGAAILILLIAFGIFLVMKTRSVGAQADEAMTAVATRGMLETYIEGNGVTAAKKREELGKELKGKVSEILVSVGDEVKAGDALLVVNPTETREELKSAENELVNVQRGVSDAQAEVARAQTQVNAAQKRLNKLTITAPFTGKLIPATDADGKAPVYRVGQQLSEGTVIGYMVDESKMMLSLYFSAAYSGQIQSGQKVTVSVPSAMSTVSGVVSSIESAQRISNEGVKLFRVNLSLENPGTLTKGMIATATIVTEAGELYPAESGTLEYAREETVTVQTGGEIAALNGIDYYSYTGGATIMQLTSDAAQDELKNAQSSVITAQNGVVNAQKLVQSKQERIAELKKLIANATVKSPIDGVVVSLSVVEEQVVSGTQALVVVADLNDIIVNANITATDVSAVTAGQPATMTMYTSDGELMMTGMVDSVALEPSQDSSGGQGSMPTFPAVISIDPVEGRSVAIGQGVDYRITTASSMDCLIVPSSAVVNTEDGTAVFAKPAEGQSFDNALPLPEGTEGVPPDFVLVPVEVGISDASNTEILSGISDGDIVFLALGDLYGDMGMGDMSMTAAVG